MTTETILTLKHWGNNLGVRLPAAIAGAARLHAEQRVRVMVEGPRVVIEPVADEPLSLAQRLALFNPAEHGGEAMQTPTRLGAEQW